MRARCCNAVVAAQRQLQTAAHAYAVNRRNDGLARALYLRNHGVQIGLLQGCFLAKLLDIRAPEKALPAPVITMACTAASALARVSPSSTACRVDSPRPLTGDC